MASRRTANGNMDLERSPYLIKEGDYPYAIDVSLTTTDGSVKGNIGNRKINYTLPAGTNKCVGFKEDQVRGRAFYFVYNSDGKHSILIFNQQARTITKLLENKTNTGGIDILRWLDTTKILHIDILYRDAAEGDILSWTDNNQPKEVIIDKLLSNAYGVVLEEYIEAAKRPPLTAPICAYANDLAKNVNSLKKKLFQFKYRFIYDDYASSTWSPVSKLPLPAGLFSNPSLDNNPGYNNSIGITVETGNKKVKRIEIAGRTNNGSAWADFFLIASLDKARLSITNNAQYVYTFLNDSSYADIDIRESNQLFDWVPKKAGSQALVNGNVKVYGEITEGMGLVASPDIRVSSELVTNDSGVAVTPPTLAWDGGYDPAGNNDGILIVGGTPSAGVRYVVYWIPEVGVEPQIFMDYTAVPGDTNSTIAYQLQLQRDSFALGLSLNVITVTLNVGMQIYSSYTTGSGSSGAGYEGTWNWWSRYNIGVQYYDEQGRTPGVQFDTTLGRANSDITTQGYSIVSGVGQTPELIVELRHQPPAWAKKFQMVRSRNLTIGNFLFWKTDHIAADDEFYYFSIQTLVNKRDTQTGYVPEYDFAEGDRCRIVINNIGASQTYPSADYLVVGVEVADKGAGEKTYAKVRKPAGSPTYTNPCLIQLWTPAKTGGFKDSEVYYEFGEVYDVYISAGTLSHRGVSQDQTIAQPAIIRLRNGDIYYRKRTFVTPSDALWVTDLNYSDDFKSAVNSNGRPSVLDYNAKETYYPTMVRFSGAYQQGTFVNELSRFFFENFDEYDRGFGAIKRMRVTDRYLRIFQELKTGRVPVYQQVIKDAVGGDILAQSDRLLNNIQYYAGDFGIGKHPESLASRDFADYFVDSNRGVMLRLSLDGLTPISITSNANEYFVRELSLRGAVNVYGVFDPKENRYILSMGAVSGSAAQTIVFNEQKKGYETFLRFTPEFMGCLGTQLISFVNGELWTHDSTTYCNYYGVQYKPSITMMFNDALPAKKTFQAVSYIGGAKWACPEIVTSLDQLSRLQAPLFGKKEDVWHSYLLRDINSPKGILSGDMLKGQWIKISFEKENGATGEELHYAEVKYVISNLNAR